MGKLSRLVRKMTFMHRSSHDGDLRSAAASGSISRRLSLIFGSSRASSQRSARSSSMSSSDTDCDCEEADCNCSRPAPDVPAGCLPVYVGEERRRFVVPTTYLTNSAFQALLAKSEGEYGLRCDGGLRIACFPDAFERLLWSLQGDATVETEQLLFERSLTGRSGG